MDHAALCKELDVSRETSERLQIYGEQLSHWNKALNLVSPASVQDMWRRHFFDSAQLLAHAPPGVRSWLDLGSGAGFPGLVVAIIAMEQRPDLAVTLVESDRRKSVFLRETARACGAPVIVMSERVENITFQADIISARALAPLGALLTLATPLLSPEGHCLFLKGSSAAAEIEAIAPGVAFTITSIPSRTDSTGVILRIHPTPSETL